MALRDRQIAHKESRMTIDFLFTCGFLGSTPKHIRAPRGPGTRAGSCARMVARNAPACAGGPQQREVRAA